MDANQIPGYIELGLAAGILAEARYDYDRASNHGYPVAEARAMGEAERAYAAIVPLYPVAAALRMAQGWERASNYAKSGAGHRASGRILAGEDYALVIAEMQAEWAADAERMVANA